MRVVSSKHKKDHRSMAKKLKGNRFRIKKRKIFTREEVIHNIVDKLHISEDMINGAEIISMVGKRNLVIENYVRVVVYEEDRIVVKTKKNYVTVCGSNLKIEYMMDIEMRISGRIRNIEFAVSL